MGGALASWQMFPARPRHSSSVNLRDAQVVPSCRWIFLVIGDRRTRTRLRASSHEAPNGLRRHQLLKKRKLPDNYGDELTGDKPGVSSGQSKVHDFAPIYSTSRHDCTGSELDEGTTFKCLAPSEFVRERCYRKRFEFLIFRDWRAMQYAVTVVRTLSRTRTTVTPADAWIRVKVLFARTYPRAMILPAYSATRETLLRSTS